MRIKTYVINLPESEARREYIRKETAKYPFLDVELVEGIKGKYLTEEELKQRFARKHFFRLYSRYPTPGEIGCTLSHRKCYERLLASEEQVALILEDDVAFTCPDALEEVTAECLQLLKDGCAELILCSQQVCYYSVPAFLTKAYAAYPVYNAYGTYAYFINRRGAEHLLRKKRPFIVADDYQWMREEGVKIKCVFPSIAKECSSEQHLGSLIDSERRTNMLECIKRPFYLRVWYGLKVRILYQYERRMLKKGKLINQNRL